MRFSDTIPLVQQQEQQSAADGARYNRNGGGWNACRTTIYMVLGFAVLGLVLATLFSVEGQREDLHVLLQHSGLTAHFRDASSSPSSPSSGLVVAPSALSWRSTSTSVSRPLRGEEQGAPVEYVVIAHATIPSDLLDVVVAQHVRPAITTRTGVLGGCYARNASHETCVAVVLPRELNATLLGVAVDARDDTERPAAHPIYTPKRRAPSPVATSALSPLRRAAQCEREGDGDVLTSRHSTSRCARCTILPECRCAFGWFTEDDETCVLSWCTSMCLSACEEDRLGCGDGFSALTQLTSVNAHRVYVVSESFSRTAPGRGDEQVSPSVWWTRYWTRLASPHLSEAQLTQATQQLRAVG
jgi:hypothetical protein